MTETTDMERLGTMHGIGAVGFGEDETVGVPCEYLKRLISDADRLARAEALLRELGEYFDNYADVTDSDRGVAEVPNEAMEWKSRIDEFLSGE